MTTRESSPPARPRRTLAPRPAPPRPAGPDPIRFLAPAEAPLPLPTVRLRLQPADRPLVSLGDRVAIGQPLLERCRETVLVEAPARGALEEAAPGDELDPASLPAVGGFGRQAARPEDRARLMFVGPDDVARIALGRSPAIVASPVDAEVIEVAAGHLCLRCEGTGLAGRVAWGQPIAGPLVMGVPSPDAELRASAIDIAAAGSVLVAGARLDIEALTRARAIGVAGVICGGLVGRELRQLEEADVRQRAALHAAAPFAVVALDGYGRRVMPTRAWELLSAAAGRSVGLVPEARLVVVSGDADPRTIVRHGPDEVRIASGEGAGRVARILGLAGPTRRSGGVYLPSGFIEETGLDGLPRRRIVPLTDLERLG